ncbi:MAG: chromosome segregation protein [Candidatus Woesearchaeota archaeon]|jgi:chromosome segregation protein
MKGFKSFARQTDLVFGDDFNVILGPNGSGKSNVFDALCFVLGKASAKGLRAEKSANLIYNGGKTKKGAKEGEVSIYFDNKDKVFPIDTKEVKVTRIIKESGQSVYKINGKKHTRTEILDLLQFGKINPDGYNIILQGDIVRLVEMSGDDRRRIIEQISDISIYEEKKHKAYLELEKVEDSLKEAQIILGERESYLKDLRKEKEQATVYQQAEDLVKKGRATVLRRTIDDKKKRIEDIHTKNETNVEKQKSLQTDIDDLKAKTADKKKEVDAINAEIESKGDKEQVALHKEIEALKIDVATGETRIGAIKDEISRVEERRKQLDSSSKEISVKIKDLEQTLKEQENNITNNSKLEIQVKEKIGKFKKKHNLEGAPDIEQGIDEFDKQIDTEQHKIDALREKQQDALRNKDRLEMQIRNADEKIDKVLEVSNQNKQEVAALKQKKLEFKKVTLELSKSLSEDGSIVSQLSNSRSRLHFVNEELAKLNARSATIQETLGGGMAVSKILEQKKKIGGIFGTISSLGSADKEYAKALEIAAGGKIKAVVVESDSIAQKAISFLKENKLGVASFMPLNKIRAPTINKNKDLLAQKGVHGYAIDLISFDKKYQKVFENVFSSTLIVDSIAVARRIGIGTIRMVTLEGDVAETSGIMQGGFRKSHGTGMSFSQKDITEKIEKFDREAADLSNVTRSLESRRMDNEEIITRFRELKANLEGDIIKVEKSLHLETGDFDMSQKLKVEFETELKTVDKEFRDIQMQISGVNRDLATFKVERQKLKTQVMDLRNPTKVAELNTLLEQERMLHEGIIRAESEIKHIKNQSANMLGPEAENTRKIIQQHDREIAEFKTERSRLQELSKKNITVLKDKESREQAFYKQFQKAFAQRTALTKDIVVLESKTIKKEDDIREFERKNTVVSIEVARFQAELTVISEEYVSFKDIEVYKTKPTDEIKRSISDNEAKLRRIGPVNMKAVKMYDKVHEQYDQLVAKKEILVNEREHVHIMINEIEVRKKDLFMAVYDRLNTNFQRIFKSLSTKGEAFIELENPEQPFEGGVNIKVKLTGTKFMDIRSLSGGEKTMTALAFIFAVQENDPAYFYIMDEVDAALDKRNSEKLANLIKQYSDKAQYIVISHNDGLISSANTLYGVSMEQQAGVSKVVSLKL